MDRQKAIQAYRQTEPNSQDPYNSAGVQKIKTVLYVVHKQEKCG